MLSHPTPPESRSTLDWKTEGESAPLRWAKITDDAGNTLQYTIATHGPGFALSISYNGESLDWVEVGSVKKAMKMAQRHLAWALDESGSGP